MAWAASVVACSAELLAGAVVVAEAEIVSGAERTESKEFNVADTPPDANSEANVWSGGAVADGGLAVKELADARAAARCVTWGLLSHCC